MNEVTNRREYDIEFLAMRVCDKSYENYEGYYANTTEYQKGLYRDQVLTMVEAMEEYNDIDG